MNSFKLLLAAALCCLLLSSSPSTVCYAQDLFCFAGQSNMLGWTLGGQSLNGNSELLTSLVNELETQGTASEASLTNIIQQKHLEANVYVASVVQTEVDALLDLDARGLTSALTSPLNHATFTLTHGTSGPITVSLVDAVYSGISYGPEYMFSRTMQAKYNYATETTPLVIRKAARGGTQIYKDWSPTLPGTRWPELQSAITNAPAGGTFQGFVWFQGENDCFHTDGDPSDDTYLYYYGNLTELVTQVRQLMFDQSPVGAWDQPSSIPVVIVQLGYWPGGGAAHVQEAYDQVTGAQQLFAANDGCSALVTTNDLCRFFHFDAPSQLIIGDRVAHAMASLQGCTTTPPAPTEPPVTAPPTPSPTSPPTEPPTTAPPVPSPTSPCDACTSITVRNTCESCSIDQCTWSGGNGPNGQCNVVGGGGSPTMAPAPCSSCGSYTDRNACESCACLWQNNKGSKTCVNGSAQSSAQTTADIFEDTADTIAPSIAGFMCGACLGLDDGLCSDCGDCIWRGNQCVPW